MPTTFDDEGWQGIDPFVSSHLQTDDLSITKAMEARDVSRAS